MKKLIALTFDDGPGEYTERLLDILSQYNAKATFFVLGNCIDNKESILERMINEGHEIGNHTFSHRPLTYMTDDEIMAEITDTTEKISSACGTSPSFVRAPYGDINEKVQNIGKSLNVAFAGWALDTVDWNTKDSDAVCASIVNEAAEGDIVLCHDPHKSTVDAIEKALPLLIENGFQSVTLSELLTSNDGYIEAGKVYFRR